MRVDQDLVTAHAVRHGKNSTGAHHPNVFHVIYLTDIENGSADQELTFCSAAKQE